MDCHRQETSGLPNTNGTCSDGKYATQGACVAARRRPGRRPGTACPLTVGPYHSTVTFPSHPAGNQFLNSPHAKFTGQVERDRDGQVRRLVATGKYQSSFMDHGEAYNTGNGCTGCHEIHTSIVVGEKPFREECNTCHHVKSLEHLLHPEGAGTPLEKAEEDPMEACVMCHMPERAAPLPDQHRHGLLDLPDPPAMTANTAANTAPDGSYTNAVWVDLDAACGQCHGGGTANVEDDRHHRDGLGRPDGREHHGLAVGERIHVAGAGAYSAKSGAAGTTSTPTSRRSRATSSRSPAPRPTASRTPWSRRTRRRTARAT